MNNSFGHIVIFLILFAATMLQAKAQPLLSIDTDDVIVCQTKVSHETRPKFTESNCQSMSLTQLDPQNKEVWFKANLFVSQAYLERNQPTALFIFGKMSSEVYFNGQLLGNNGTPSFLAKDEFSGDMDARFYLPTKLINQGDNELVIHASAHHGVLRLAMPIHFIGLSEYGQTNDFFKADLWLLLSLFGALILGCIYLAVIAWQSEQKKSAVLILLMMLLSSGQLFLEISRALLNYSYPFHDIRLILITLVSFGIGCCFLAFSIEKFVKTKQRTWLIIGILLTAILVVLIPGFDSKTVIAILIPALISTMLSGYKYKTERTSEFLVYLFAYASFTFTIVATFSYFHSAYFYYIVTSMMAFLVIRKANELSKEKQRRKSEEKQVLKLQFKLEQVEQQNTPIKLKITSAGKTELLASQSIAYCKAAGDYVEVFLTDKRQILFSGTLKSIESQLPSTFLKVHRSYIVNLDEVVAIVSAKNKAGSSSLVLQTADEIPISRRILPQVKGAINSTL